ncbi:D-aminoacyl-tRNA deacylase [Desulfocurvibacter africanus]|uniref:D-aminoacyl-tRNA deacylase n=1 Tax=Desulfocurvibacter africanus subsp. africanus str. Walvis Bay TaxID=690850 RepID=F3YYG7_DESAF|nr:D-aminoacyl-tRNA deacylase [Desulfocurvibacter africanus]EGJ50721.1 D-tyrosyl-tRNA(Tyr) deacylase [Desulfocurvibacter africanus subsp. africanus str. Walvis Bay]
MRFLLQRVRHATVRVREPAGWRVSGSINQGFVLLAGFGREDGSDLPESPVWKRMIEKVLDLRVFADEVGKLNLSLREAGGEMLVVSQFTLYADCRRGRRPSFTDAAPSAVAEALFERLGADFESALPGRVARGVFGGDMEVELVNWGPVTIWLDSSELS